MKFAHLSDSHVGGWRDPVLRETGIRCFEEAIDFSIEEGVDFILIAGDLFDVPRPGIDSMTRAVEKMKEATEKGIRIYVVEGSHDYSPTGKTMTRVLEKTGLFTRVSKAKSEESESLVLRLTHDKETNTWITGLPGKRGALERKFYEKLRIPDLEEVEGFKVFMFHSGLDVLKPKELRHAEFLPISLLPKGFDYYAGGHMHIPRAADWSGYGKIVYPGALFPEDFRELERLTPGFYVVEVTNGEIEAERKILDLYHVVSVELDAQDKSAEQVEEELLDRLEEEDVADKFVLLRIEGTLSRGRPSDIDFRHVASELSKRGAALFKRNTAKLRTKEYEEIKVQSETREELEDDLIREHAGQHDLEGFDKEAQVKLTKNLLASLGEDVNPDELVKDYRERIKENVLAALDVREEWQKWDEA